MAWHCIAAGLQDLAAPGQGPDQQEPGKREQGGRATAPEMLRGFELLHLELICC